MRVRRKLANGTGDVARAKPQPSVQDSGFSTETSCGKDAQAARSRPVEDELWTLLDVIQRKGSKLRDEFDSLRGQLDASVAADESFAAALAADRLHCECEDASQLRRERDELLVHSARLEAEIASVRAAPSPAPAPASTPLPRTPLGRLDRVLSTPSRPPQVPTPDSRKFAAILLESNPVELQRHLLTSTVHTEVRVEIISI